MDLILTVIRYQNLPADRAITVRIGAAGGTIGRKPDNDLVLPDPDRWVGRQHARISFRDGAYYLTDSSKNGTFVNGAAEPLRTGQEVELRDGDELSIGAYELRVSLPAAQPSQADSLDPFAPVETGLEPLAETPSAGTAPDILDLVPGAPGGHEQSSGADVELESSAQTEDRLSADAKQDGAWTLGTEEEAPATPIPPTEPDHTPHENAFFNPPGAVLEDYDLLADEIRPADDSAGAAAAGAERAPDSQVAATAVTQGQQGQRPSASPAAERFEPKSARGGSQQANELKAFLAGLGAGELPTDPADQARLMQTAGLLLRAMTAGLMRVLMGRSSFKSELRLEMTAIRSTRNNPFKFSVDPEAALDQLLFRPSRGFLSASSAAQEAFDDIQCHEMAIMAGLRAALHALLERLDPAQLEQRFRDRSVLDNLMPMARKAKYWDLFIETYEEISRDASEDFLNLFNDAFTRAYEEQAVRLRQTRRSGETPAEER